MQVNDARIAKDDTICKKVSGAVTAPDDDPDNFSIAACVTKVGAAEPRGVIEPVHAPDQEPTGDAVFSRLDRAIAREQCAVEGAQ